MGAGPNWVFNIWRRGQKHTVLGQTPFFAGFGPDFGQGDSFGAAFPGPPVAAAVGHTHQRCPLANWAPETPWLPIQGAVHGRQVLTAPGFAGWTAVSNGDHAPMAASMLDLVIRSAPRCGLCVYTTNEYAHGACGSELGI